MRINSFSWVSLAAVLDEEAVALCTGVVVCHQMGCEAAREIVLPVGARAAVKQATAEAIHAPQLDECAADNQYANVAVRHCANEKPVLAMSVT